MATTQQVFLTGGTGYLGRALATTLLQRGHSVSALVRPGSESRLVVGCGSVLGNALDHRSYASRVAPGNVFVHLIGVAHPGPSKAPQFRTVDLASAREAVQAAVDAKVVHFVYVSVAHPAPVMRAYWEARAEAESCIRAAGLPATILRPWYVLGPGHRWPLMLAPLYWVAEQIPATRETARRLGLVTLKQVNEMLVWSVEHPASAVRVLEVPEIRSGPRPPSPAPL